MQCIWAQDKSSGRSEPLFGILCTLAFSSYRRANVVGIHRHASWQRACFGSRLAFSYNCLPQLVRGLANENLKYSCTQEKLPISIKFNFWANFRPITIKPVLKLLRPNKHQPIHKVEVGIMAIDHFNPVCNCEKQQGPVCAIPPQLRIHDLSVRSQHGCNAIHHRKTLEHDTTDTFP